MRQAALADDERVHPLVRQALPFVGHFVTRNRGTVGGSIAHADGAAELPLCLVALGGVVVVDGPSGRREIPADDFFVTHFLTTLAPGELVVETAWPRQTEGEACAFVELALRAGDFAQSMVAVVLRREAGVVSAARVAVGAVTDRPTRLPRSRSCSSGRAASTPRPKPGRWRRGSSTRPRRRMPRRRTCAR